MAFGVDNDTFRFTAHPVVHLTFRNSFRLMSNIYSCNPIVCASRSFPFFLSSTRSWPAASRCGQHFYILHIFLMHFPHHQSVHLKALQTTIGPLSPVVVVFFSTETLSSVRHSANDERRRHARTNASPTMSSMRSRFMKIAYGCMCGTNTRTQN